MNRRTYLMSVAASGSMLLLILDSRCALENSQAAMELCFHSVIPSLFPFLFLSTLVTTSIWGGSGKWLRALGWMLQLPSGTESLVLSGFLGGYPAGAAAIGDAFRRGGMNRKDGERLLCFCSNAGPAFLFGMVGPQFPEKSMIWVLWGIHILSAVLVGALIPYPTELINMPEIKKCSLSQTMMQSVKTMGMICGWIFLFRILLGFLDRWIFWLFPDSLRIILWGLLELANGCCALNQISDISLRFVIASAMLSFGGFCVLLQTSSVVSGLSIRGYLVGKMMQTLFSVLIAAAFCFGHGEVTCFISVLFLILPKIRKKSSSIHSLSGV